MPKFLAIIVLSGILLSCNKENPSIVLPTISTSEVTDVEAFTATGGGTVAESGDSELLAIGIVVGETPGATINDGLVTETKVKALGAFTVTINALRSNTTYYLRAFATNSAGTAYGEEKIFNTVQAIPTSLEFTMLTTIKGYNFTQAIGLEGSEPLQSLFLANRQIDPSVGIQYERLYRYDLLNNSSAILFNPIVDFISKEIQIIDNQIIVIGADYVSTYEFDLESPPVVVPHNLSFTRHGSGQWNGVIYAYGGDRLGVDSDKIWRWDVAGSNFVLEAAMPTAKSYAGGEVVNDKLYIFGGQKEFSGTLHDDIIYAYDFITKTINTYHLPIAMYRTFTAKVGNLIYLAGHINPTGSDNTDIIFGVFDTSTNQFTEININLSDAEGASIWAMTAIGNDLYVVYGDPINDIDQLTLEQTFTIQKAAIP